MPGLPQFVEPLRLAETRESLGGEMPVSGMERLGELLIRKEGTVKFLLRFEENAQGFVCIQGQFSTGLTMTCQRCLAPVRIRVSGPISVMVMEESRETDLAVEEEPVLLHERKLHLAGFLEDEILLALPLAPAHPGDQCAAAVNEWAAGPQTGNPFASLRAWKRRA